MSSPPINPNAGLGLRATTATAKASPADEGRAENWAREMERAQMELWLSHSVVGYRPLALSGSAASTASPTSAASPQVTAAPVSIAGPRAVARHDSHESEVAQEEPAQKRDHQSQVHQSQIHQTQIEQREAKLAPRDEQQSSRDEKWFVRPFVHASPAEMQGASVLTPASSDLVATQPPSRVDQATPTARANASLRNALLGTKQMANELIPFGPIHASTSHPSIEGASEVVVLAQVNEPMQVPIPVLPPTQPVAPLNEPAIPTGEVQTVRPTPSNIPFESPPRSALATNAAIASSTTLVEQAQTPTQQPLPLQPEATNEAG
ncbi:MAG: hypothetical protein H7255_05795, partial [Ramlibacter sp.]|nr:hypothetical protein [Ramlibacter sp.]